MELEHEADGQGGLAANFNVLRLRGPIRRFVFRSLRALCFRERSIPVSRSRIAGNRPWGRALGGVVLGLAFCIANPAAGFDREDYEEDAGSGVTLLLGSDSDSYGFALGWGVWLRNAPVFGDYSLSLFRNGREKALYSGAGLTLRAMPRWTLAPFAGAGGGYNHALDVPRQEDGDSLTRGASYWSGHAEVGFRLWLGNRSRYLDAAYRQTWSSRGDDRDYGLFLLAIGIGAGHAHGRLNY